MELKNIDKIILHLCATMGSDSLPYKEAGYDVRLIGKDIGVENYNPPDNVYGIIANPVCRDFSIALTKPKIPRDLERGMFLVKHCLRISWECLYKIKRTAYPVSPLKFWYIENPATGYLRWFLGKPAFEYQPYEYGEMYSKKTALWGYFNIPKKPLLYNPIKSNMNFCKSKEILKKMPVGSELRSKCPYNFSKAFFESNQ